MVFKMQHIMKKYLYAILAGAAMIVSCNKTNTDVDVPAEDEVEVEHIVFDLGREEIEVDSEDTKAYFHDGWERQWWKSGDQISVWSYAESYAQNRCFTNTNTEDGVLARFEGVAPKSSTYYILSPYNPDARKEENRILTTIPSEQKLVGDMSCDPNALLSCKRVKYTGSSNLAEFSMRNIFSVIRFTVNNDDITKVTVIGRSGEAISGTVSFDAYSESFKIDNTGACNYATLTPAGETFEKDKEYGIVVTPNTYATGFTLVFHRSSSVKVAVKSVKMNNMKLDRNHAVILPLAFSLKDADYKYYFLNEIQDVKDWRNDTANWANTDIVYLNRDIDCSGVQRVQTAFKGTFEGNYKRLYNLKLTGLNQRAGFFFEVSGTVRNVCFGSKDYNWENKQGTYDGTSYYRLNGATGKDGAWYYAGCIAYLQTNGRVENVVNFAKAEIVSGTYTNNYHFRLGGICGTMKGSTAITNCINFGDVTSSIPDHVYASTTHDIGGIVSRNDGNNCSITGCINYGKVTNSSPGFNGIGGIIGTVSGGSNALTLSNCKNFGNVSNTVDLAGGNIYIGGIAGAFYGSANTIEALENNGAISNTGNAPNKGSASDNFYVYAGGVFGRIELAQTITEMKNTGNITMNIATARDSQLYVGGIAATGEDKKVSYDNCTNEGNITVENFTNTANYYTYISGIAASPANVTNCKNTGDITYKPQSGKLRLGGITGYYNPESTSIVFQNNTSECAISVVGKSTVACFVGGLIGSHNNGTNPGVKGCSFKGSIAVSGCDETTTSDADKGGAAGGLIGACYTMRFNGCSVDLTSGTGLTGGTNTRLGLYTAGTCKDNADRTMTFAGTDSYVKSGSKMGSTTFTTNSQLTKDTVIGTRNAGKNTMSGSPKIN